MAGEVVTSYDRLSSEGRLPLPQEVKPFDPAILEATSGKELQILAKAIEVVRQAGVVDLPEGREGPPVFIEGGNITIQAFSSNGEVVFITIAERIDTDEYTRMNIGDRPFLRFVIGVQGPNGGPHFLELSNPVKSAVYQRLQTETRGEYTALDFEKDEFVDLSPQRVQELVGNYLKSNPRPDLADDRYKDLKKFPGGGTVSKLYN